jgi:hypothetical protein
MKRAGRISPFAIVGVICVLLIIPLLCASKKGPEYTAAQFMTALGNGDVNGLSKLSSMGNLTEDQMREKWQKTINDSKYYMFTWRITDVTTVSDSTAAIKMQMRRDLKVHLGDDEMPFEIPVVKVNGEWKVPVYQIDREIYPYLPQP